MELPEYDKISYLFTNNKSKDTENSKMDSKISKYLPLILRLGYTFYKTEDFENAINAFNIVTENISNNYYPFYYLGLSYLANNDLEKAQINFQRSMDELNPMIAEKKLEEMIRLLDNETQQNN